MKRTSASEVEAAIQQAMTLLAPFANRDLLRRDPPIEKILVAWKSIDDQRRRTPAQWEQFAKERLPKVTHARGHPSYRLRRSLFLMVLEVLESRGFRPRRNQTNLNRSDKRQSGCSIISTALYRLGVKRTEGQITDDIRSPRQKSCARF